MLLVFYATPSLHVYASTSVRFWYCTMNYMLAPFNATPSLCLYTSTILVLYCELYACTVLCYSFPMPRPLRLYASTPLHLYASTPLRLNATLSWYIFLYTFSATQFLHFYAFNCRNLTTSKLDVSTVLIYTMLFLYAVFLFCSTYCIHCDNYYACDVQVHM